MDYIQEYNSPLGSITIASDEASVTGIWFENSRFFSKALSGKYINQATAAAEQAVHWLDIYFNNKIPDFTPPLLLKGTDFRMTVWKMLLDIPYGKTVSYGDIAKVIAKRRGIEKMSAQAVGNAVGHNPISIIVPCHRVVGSKGSLTGYGGGIKRKKELLRLESNAAVLAKLK